MGILDDAIREHLELKRRQGTPDIELKQLEDEVFGPPSRPGEPDFPERPPTGEDEALDAEAAPADPLNGDLHGEAATRMLSTEEAPVEEAPALEEAPAPDREAASAEPDSDEFGLGEPDPILDKPLAADPAEDVPIEHLETAEHPFEDGLPHEPVEAPDHEPAEPARPGEEGTEPGAADAEAGEGDVLEETPEFLQDRPEDDELWFEQGEPKDFDF